MYLYDSIRSYARSLHHSNRFVVLHSHDDDDDDDDSERDGLTARGRSFKDDLKSQPEWDEKSDVKMDGWISTCSAEHQSHPSNSQKCFRSRLLPTCRRKALTRKIRKRLAATTCFVNHHRSSDSGLQPACPVAANTYETSQCEVSRNRSNTRHELGVDVRCLSPKSSVPKSISERSIRGSQTHSNWSANELTVIDENEVRASHKKRKPRQVTRYYSPKTIHARTAQAAHYPLSAQGARRAPRDSRGAGRGPTHDKAPVGRHLEWLKFLA